MTPWLYSKLIYTTLYCLVHSAGKWSCLIGRFLGAKKLCIHVAIWFRMKSWRKKSCRLELKYFRHWTRNILIVVWCTTVSCFMTATHGGRFMLVVLILSDDTVEDNVVSLTVNFPPVIALS